MKNSRHAERDGKHKKPRRLKKLPDWFRLANYEPVRTLDALGWWQQINIRRACYDQLKDMRSEHPLFSERDAAVKKALFSSRQQPICSTSCAPFNGEEFSWCFNIEFLPEQEGDGPIVREMRLLDLYKFERDARSWWQLSKEKIEEAEKLVNHPSPFIFLSPTPAWMKPTVRHKDSTSSIVPVVLDLDLPNAAVIEHFKLLLQKLRRERQTWAEATKHMPELMDWARNGLLPCMDLILWAEEEQGRITDGFLADAVFPEGEGDEQKIRKTLRPHTWDLLKPTLEGIELMQRLRALAYTDFLQRQEVRKRRARGELENVRPK